VSVGLEEHAATASRGETPTETLTASTTHKGGTMRDRLPMILSTTALLVALFGATPLGEAAYNALPRNSVGTVQLKRNAVTSSKLAPNTVRASQIVNASLLAEDFKPGQLPAGPKGDKGDKGDRGPVGLSGYEIVTASASVGPNTTLSAIQPRCPAGKKVLGGTMGVQGVARGFFFHTSVVSSTSGSSDIFSVTATNTTTTARDVVARAICARVAT
jgi:hypothetical protein